MSWELLHLADGKVSVRRDGRELGIIVAPDRFHKRVDVVTEGFRNCPECAHEFNVTMTDEQEIEVDLPEWTRDMERLLNQADAIVQAKQTGI